MAKHIGGGVRRAVIAAFMLLSAARAGAAIVLVNGGFESGLAGWTQEALPSTDGGFYAQSGLFSPLNALDVPSPPEGTSAAMTDMGGPGARVLYQDFLATDASGVLSFMLFIGNRAPEFASPETLDPFGLDFNQQARVDILRGGSDPFSVDAADVLLTVYRTQPGDPVVLDAYILVSADISAILTANLNQTLRLRFAGADNLDIFNLGIDDVRIVSASDPTPVPAPGTAALAALGIATIAASRRRRAARV